MMLGYDRPLYLLPFDHRHSYGSGCAAGANGGAR